MTLSWNFHFSGSSWPKDQIQVSYIGRRVLYHWATRGVHIYTLMYTLHSTNYKVPGCTWPAGIQVNTEIYQKTTRKFAKMALCRGSGESGKVVHRFREIRKIYESRWKKLRIASLVWLAEDGESGDSRECVVIDIYFTRWWSGMWTAILEVCSLFPVLKTIKNPPPWNWVVFPTCFCTTHSCDF